MPHHPCRDRPSRFCPSRRLRPTRRVLLVAATLIGAFAATRDGTRSGGGPASDVISPGRATAPADSTDSKPFLAQSWVTPKGHTPSAHSSTICSLPSGDLFVVWYGGSREGAADVALFASRLAAGAAQWAVPVKVVDRALAESELDRRIKKVGNAVVFPDAAGTLWMIYVSVSIGGWSGSALNIKTSRDEGVTWSESERLTLNPFFNLSSLVRNKPIQASDGRIGVPVYHELALKFPQMLWITPGPGGRIDDYRIRNLSAESGMIQPTLIPLEADRVLMMLRDRSDVRRLRTAYSGDNGWTWSGTEKSELPNPDSAIDALRLRDGRILLAYNHAISGRENLRLALSADEGRTWRPGPVLEAANRQEYSYPQLAEDRRGRIHVTYTWQRERIRHLQFNIAWLDREMADPALVAMAQ